MTSASSVVLVIWAHPSMSYCNDTGNDDEIVATIRLYRDELAPPYWYVLDEGDSSGQ